MIGDFSLAISQVFDRRFMGVLIKSVALTAALLSGLIVITIYLLAYIPSLAFSLPLIGEITFLDELISSVGFGLIMFLSVVLMFPVAAVFVGLFLEDIADAVEAKHYPQLGEPRRQSWGEILTHALEFALVLIGANLLALIIYLISAILAPVIFWAVNGYLIGREYFEVVAYRRMEERAAKTLRRKHFFSVWMAGVLVAIPLSVPILNIIAPLVGVAAFVHLYHRKAGNARV